MITLKQRFPELKVLTNGVMIGNILFPGVGPNAKATTQLVTKIKEWLKKPPNKSIDQ